MMPQEEPGNSLDAPQPTDGVTFLFPAGERPTAKDIEVLLDGETDGIVGACVSHHPGDDHGWLEVLASGLTFEVTGLSPAPSQAVPPVGKVYGLPQDIDRFGFEAVTIVLGHHIAAAAGMMPVIRILTGLAANFASHLPAAAVCWNPAGSWMEPKYFCRLVVNWLAGGPFPALGLTSINQCGDGSVETAGLAYFLGQEIRVAPRPRELGSDLTKLASRIITDMVLHGPFHTREEIRNEGGEILIAEPSSDLRMVTISRGI